MFPFPPLTLCSPFFEFALGCFPCAPLPSLVLAPFGADFRKGDARAILKQLSENPSEQGTWDLAFIDADKVSYDIYYEHILKLLRKGGVIAVDNVLWDGAVADPLVNDEDTKALRALNKKVTAHSTTVAMPSVPHQTPIV